MVAEMVKKEKITNTLEIVEFRVADTKYGVNVAKVKEIIFPEDIVPIPKTHDCIEGIIDYRGHVIPVINLRKYLKGDEQKSKTDRFLIIEFEGILSAFRVCEVHRIRQISWEGLEPPGDLIGGEKTAVIGIVRIEEMKKELIVMMLDFEKVISEIDPPIQPGQTRITKDDKVDRNSKKIMVVEDSPSARKTIVMFLERVGYNNITTFKNAMEAYDYLSNIVIENIDNSSWNIKSYFDLVITDIEMPLMDGHTFTKKIKEHEKLESLPVIIFSSLSNESNINKSNSIGVSAVVIKPNYEELIKTIDKLFI